MSRPVTSDLERLSRGRAVSKDAFLSLLADPQARADLDRIAQARDLLDPSAGEEPPPPALPVGWDDLVAYLDGTLANPGRRRAVEEFLRRQAPELIPTVEDTPTGVDFGDDTATWVEPPRPRRGAENDPPPNP